jgi:hypothetical protein
VQVVVAEGGAEEGIAVERIETYTDVRRLFKRDNDTLGTISIPKFAADVKVLRQVEMSTTTKH